MRLRTARRVANERGVAMITVLFVGAALTVVAATASFATIQELGITNDDRLSAQALAYAEAGIDRAIGGIRLGSSATGNISWLDMMLSGCGGGPPGGRPILSLTGSVGNGRFVVEIQRPVPLTSCNASAVPFPNEAQDVNITSTGTAGTASRTVRQEVRVGRTDVPIGLLTTSDVNVNGAGAGNPARIRRISLITEGNLLDRDFIAFEGFDPWYSQDDFYGNGKEASCRDGQACTSATHLPAAAHSSKVITCAAGGQGNNPGPCGATKTEHDDDYPVSCNANPRGTANQSAWDGSINGAITDGTVAGITSCTGSNVGAPPTTKYPAPGKSAIPIPQLTEEDHENLKAQALTSGLYCTPTKCRFKGGPEQNFTGTIAGNEAGWNTLPDNFTAYFDFPSAGYPQPPANSVTWGANVGPCSTTPDQNRSVIIVVRNGDFNVSGGTVLAGAVLAQQGDVSFAGGAGINGSVLARKLTMAGNANFTLDDCALLNLLNPFLDVTPVRWLELDRPVG